MPRPSTVCPGFGASCGSVIPGGRQAAELCVTCRRLRKLARDGERARERYNIDPEYRARIAAQHAEFRRRRKADPDRAVVWRQQKSTYQRDRRRTDPEFAERHRSQVREYQRRCMAEDGGPLRRRRQASTFGLTVAEIAARLAAQGGRCAICQDEIRTGLPNAKRGASAHVDHDHRFDKKDPRGHRGMLCTRCNARLGFARERRDLLSPPEVEYLRAHEVEILRIAASDL